MAEGKGYSDMYRNTSEELFLKSLMENSVTMPVPTLDMLGFKNISSHLHHHNHHHHFRIDSEELFKTWLNNGENHEFNSSSIAHRTRQASRRLSTELSNLASQQPQQNKRINEICTENDYPVPDTPASDLNNQSFRNSIENAVPASNLNFAKAWFHSSQPMTRSRSSELRKRYAALQSAHAQSNLRQEFADPVNEVGNHSSNFMSPSNSTSNPFNTVPEMGEVDRVSSVVSMLKGTLERKKLGNQIEKETAEDSYNALYHAQQIVQGAAEIDIEGFVNRMNQVHQMSRVSREPSQSESSAAAPVDVCDGPSISSQALNMGESSRKLVENNNSSEKVPLVKDLRERIIENLKEDRKRGGLVRYNSVNSVVSVDKGDPTKKRRVERSRKMAEAKERNSTPAIPSDMQAVLKRCENLEKEVRSLKLNLSFMNRKDSEQTKQIEELQKKNEELADEKERLLEEIERILSETGKM